MARDTVTNKKSVTRSRKAQSSVEPEANSLHKLKETLEEHADRAEGKDRDINATPKEPLTATHEKRSAAENQEAPSSPEADTSSPEPLQEDTPRTATQVIRATIDRKLRRYFSEFMDECSEEEKYFLQEVFEIRDACYLHGKSEEIHIPIAGAFEQLTCE